MRNGVFWFCRFVAGYFCIFRCNSLIINAIHFSGMLAIAGWVCLSEPLIYLILLIYMKWVDMLVRCGHIWFIFHFQFAGLLPVIFVFFDVTH